MDKNVVTEKKPLTLKETIESLASKNVNGVQLSPTTKMMIARNFTRLMELNSKNVNSFNLIMNANNRNTTLLTLINNSAAGLEMGVDFYLVNLNNNVSEIKNGFGWRALAEKFSTKEIAFAKVLIITKHDKYEFSWDQENECQVLTNYEKNVEKEVLYDDVLFTYGVVKFANGVKRTRVLSKQEIDKMRNVSPSTNKQSGVVHPSSPWAKWPLQMIEGKAYRELIRREIVLDTKKMAQMGYNLVDDETPIQIVGHGKDVLITNDNSVYDDRPVKFNNQPTNIPPEPEQKPKPLPKNIGLLIELLKDGEKSTLQIIKNYLNSKQKTKTEELTDDEIMELVALIKNKNQAVEELEQTEEK